jgi:tetratricopeptide (TPR) repeat protein
MQKHRLVLSLLFCCWLQGQIMQNDASRHISGQVTTWNGQGVANARVTVLSLSAEDNERSVFTDTDGNFTIDDIHSSHYELVAQAGGLEARERVSGLGPFPSVTLRLPKQGASADTPSSTSTVSVAAYQIPRKARQAYEKATHACTKQRLEEADHYLAEALTVFPDYSEALTLNAIRLLDEGQAQAATEKLEHALRSDPNNARAYLVLASAYNAQTHWDEALLMVDRADRLAPNAWQGDYERARAYLGKAEYATALTWLQRVAPKAPPRFAGIYFVKASILAAGQNYRGASQELQTFLALAPEDPKAPLARQLVAQLAALANR